MLEKDTEEDGGGREGKVRRRKGRMRKGKGRRRRRKARRKGWEEGKKIRFLSFLFSPPDFTHEQKKDT